MIVAVPAPIPKTVPPGNATAMLLLLLLHIPPGSPLLLKLILEPVHTEEGPLMVPGLGAAFTITGNVAEDVPQVFETK